MITALIERNPNAATEQAQFIVKLIFNDGTLYRKIEFVKHSSAVEWIKDKGYPLSADYSF